MRSSLPSVPPSLHLLVLEGGHLFSLLVNTEEVSGTVFCSEIFVLSLVRQPPSLWSMFRQACDLTIDVPLRGPSTGLGVYLRGGTPNTP